MDVFPINELIVLGTILKLNVETLRGNYYSWGPSARTCISLMDDKQLVDHIDHVASAADQFTRNCSKFQDIDAVMVSHRLFCVRPTSESRQHATANFATDHLLGFISSAYAKHDHDLRQSFYNTIRGHPWFGSSAGCIFEIHALLWLRHAPAGICLPCTPAQDGSPPLNIPVCGKNMKRFSKVDDLTHVTVDEHEPKCLVPISQTFPTLDAIVITDKFVITVQITVASKHDAKTVGFQNVYKHLPSTLSDSRQRCHVFLTDKQENVDLLRGQKLDIPQKLKIHVYSAFLDMGKWGSILTRERVEILEKERANQSTQSTQAMEIG